MKEVLKEIATSMIERQSRSMLTGIDVTWGIFMLIVIFIGILLFNPAKYCNFVAIQHARRLWRLLPEKQFCKVQKTGYFKFKRLLYFTRAVYSETCD